MAKKFETDTLPEIPTENISKSESENLLEEYKIGLIKLGLKGIADLKNKRVQNPTEFYNSLTALYNAVKKS